MPDTSSSSKLIFDLLVSGILPGIGAYVAIRINDKLKSKSTSKSLHASDMLHLRDLVSSTRSLATEYWVTEYTELKDQFVQEAKITGALHGCSEIISCLQGISDAQRLRLNDALGSFRRSCTAGDYGSASKGVEVDYLRAIEADGRALEAKVLACRWD